MFVRSVCFTFSVSHPIVDQSPSVWFMIYWLTENIVKHKIYSISLKQQCDFNKSAVVFRLNEWLELFSVGGKALSLVFQKVAVCQKNRWRETSELWVELIIWLTKRNAALEQITYLIYQQSLCQLFILRKLPSNNTAWTCSSMFWSYYWLASTGRVANG